VDGPSELMTALLGAGGTVTRFLEQLAGEPVDARVLDQSEARADAVNLFGVARGHLLLLRAAELLGRRSGHRFVYAESVLVPSRLPAAFGARLRSSADPIGRILDDEGLAVTREPLEGVGGHLVPTPSGGTGMAAEDCLLERTYRVDAGGTPVMVIAEWFLPALGAFLPAR
jgi:chorismate-pyruvate lyase